MRVYLSRHVAWHALCGTLAAPLVAGQAALVRAVDPGLSASQVSERIMATAAPIDGSVPRRIGAAASN